MLSFSRATSRPQILRGSGSLALAKPKNKAVATLRADLVPAVRVFLARRLLGRRRLEPKEAYGPHQGSEAEGNEVVRQARDGHRLAGSPDRDVDRAHQRPHRAPADAREGSLLAARPAEARRPAAQVPELPAEERSRGLPRPHQGAGPQAVAPTSPGGWRFERVPPIRG